MGPDTGKKPYIPNATYRIQFSPAFGFDSARQLLPYLSDLGISDIYASPVFKARQGSQHGYDVVDPNRINPELEGKVQFPRLLDAAARSGLGWIQDIVPNHMAFDRENRMLMDVLENGALSPYQRHFDVNWDHSLQGLRGRVLAPFLGKPYAESLHGGEIRLRHTEEGFRIHYHELAFPLRIDSYRDLLTLRVERLESSLGPDHPAWIRYTEILDTLAALGEETVRGRQDPIDFIKRELWELCENSREISSFIEENIRVFNGEPGNPASFSSLHSLLCRQVFHLCLWKLAGEEINYRRFFGLNDLICLRVEDQRVLHDTHRQIFHDLSSGTIRGCRIDHIDGLYDPAGYLLRLRDRAPEAFIVVEKILDLEEDLSPRWPVQGTTGYDFLNYTNGLFCMGENAEALSRTYRSFAGSEASFAALLSRKKKAVIDSHMQGDIDNLLCLFEDIARKDRYGWDTTSSRLRDALVEVMTSFPVYRTYGDEQGVEDRDRVHIESAAEEALQRAPELQTEIDLLRRLLSLQFGDLPEPEDKSRWIHFVMRFQQFTGPLMAKGLEDTALYAYNRLLSLNEVGGNPARFGVSRSAFHKFIRKRLRLWPHSLNATATHDTKRGEDVRARLNVLSEIPEAWEENLFLWHRINRDKKQRAQGKPAPDKNDEYFLYQALLGSFPHSSPPRPEFSKRIKDYVLKSLREAKEHTNWVNPNTEYENASLAFVEVLLDPGPDNAFLEAFVPFCRMISNYGMFNSLSQTLIKLTAPGVPDFYQGSELWDLNLVDPDNRRPVDYERRFKALKGIREMTGKGTLPAATELLKNKDDGRVKLFLIYQGLRARRENPELFEHGDYIPVRVSGTFGSHLVAFARNSGDRWALTLTPRFLTGVAEFPLGREAWSDTCVRPPAAAPAAWTDAVTGRRVKCKDGTLVGDILSEFPVALLTGTVPGRKAGL